MTRDSDIPCPLSIIAAKLSQPAGNGASFPHF